MGRRAGGVLPAVPSPCKSCIFGAPPDRVELAPGRLEEITAYLLEGRPHRCHSADRAGKVLACRGGRDLQLRVWAALGVIGEPTDAALEAAYREHMGGSHAGAADR